MVDVVTRSYDSARTGANTEETILTPAVVGSNALVKLFSLHFDDDPRLEAQPLHVKGMATRDGSVRDVLFVCTMANNVWAFDTNEGSLLWRLNLGRAVAPAPRGPKNGALQPTEIDIAGINTLWGILSTPVIDLDTKTMYVVTWSSDDGSVGGAAFRLHAVDIAMGSEVHAALPIQAVAVAQARPGERPAEFVPSGQKQRASLLLTKSTDSTGDHRKTLFVGFGMTHEAGDTTHGWLLAYDVAAFKQTAAWCTTPHGSGGGIWQAGQGPAADDSGDVYVMVGNYGDDNKPPAQGDLPESIVKLRYTPPSGTETAGTLESVAWFTPFADAERNPRGDDNFRDYDLGSGGPVPLPGMNLVIGAGKDGVLYVLDTGADKLGRGSSMAVLKQPPIFFTYFPGFGIDASQVRNLDHLFDGKTHHLHGSPVFWVSSTKGPMLFVWGENECLRAWTIDSSGTTAFAAKSAEVASAGMGGKGGMPGGLLAVSSNGSAPGTGIVWALAPVSGDANRHVVEGILRAYDAEKLDPVPNDDGTPRLKLLWDSKHIPGNTFNHCKFCPPVIADGKVFVPTYDGRVDVYGPLLPRPGGPRPSNARHVPHQG
jgi:outer membrane protein assembly factor BamB